MLSTPPSVSRNPWQMALVTTGCSAANADSGADSVETNVRGMVNPQATATGNCASFRSQRWTAHHGFNHLAGIDPSAPSRKWRNSRSANQRSPGERPKRSSRGDIARRYHTPRTADMGTTPWGVTISPETPPCPNSAATLMSSR